jgi:hypothetical protein
VTEPRIDLPRMPSGYVPEPTGRHLGWEMAESWLRESSHYWLATTRPDGRPHVVPRWGVWVEGRFWYDGSPETRHARNVEENPACALHLESGERVLVLEGSTGMAGPVTGSLAASISNEYRRKYAPAYTPSPDSWSGEDGGGMMVFSPRRGFAWSEFPADVTRYRWL